VVVGVILARDGIVDAGRRVFVIDAVGRSNLVSTSTDFFIINVFETWRTTRKDNNAN